MHLQDGVPSVQKSGSDLRNRVAEKGMNSGDPVVDPQGILWGSNIKTGDPASVQPIKIGGSGEGTVPLYNIN